MNRIYDNIYKLKSGKRHTHRKKLLSLPSMVLVLVFLSGFVSMAATEGGLEWADGKAVAGWAWDDEDPDRILDVAIEIIPEGTPDTARQTIEPLTAKADRSLSELNITEGEESHGFCVPVDWSRFSGQTFTIRAYALTDGGKTALWGTIPFDRSATGPIAAVPSAGSSKAAGPGGISAQSAADDISSEEKENYGPAAEVPVMDEKPRTSSEDGAAPAAGPGSGPGTSPSKGSAKQGELIGTFSVTGYCGCEICSSGWNMTASGTVPQANHTISADISRFPFGTKLMIDGVVYTVEDKGSGVLGNHLDIFFASHEEAVGYGTQTKEVYAVVSD